MHFADFTQTRSLPSLRSLLLLAAATVILIAGLAPSDATAIPAFARRYQSSCTTCHLAFPKLTPFGEAFRRNAYRFPAGGDELSQKEEAIPLGAEATKELWPKVVYPGEIPGSLPLSFVVDGMAKWGAPAAGAGHAHGAATGGATEDEHVDRKLAFDTLGGHVGLRSAGKLGDLASFLASIDIGGHEPIDVERANLILTPFDPATLHVKVGRFEPEVHGVSIHRGVVGHQLQVTTATAGSNPAAIEPNRTGVQLSGVAAGRVGWAAGAVENATPGLYNNKDVYARAEYKLGGMRLDGVDGQAQSAAWRERSVTLGASGWLGKAGIFNGTTLLHDDAFVRAGVDLHAVFDDLLFDCVAARQMNDAPTDRPEDDATLDLVYAELTHVTWAFLFPTLRFEAAKASGQDAGNGTRWQALATVNALLRPNVVLRAEGAYAAEPGGHAEFSYAALAFSTAW